MEEKARNEKEDNTEHDDVVTQIAQVDVELERFYEAISDGVMAETVSKPINERLRGFRHQKQLRHLSYLCGSIITLIEF